MELFTKHSNHSKSFILSLLIFSVLALMPSVHAASPVINSTQNFACNTHTCLATLIASNTGDSLFEAISIQGNNNASVIIPWHVISITDNKGDTWIQATQVSFIQTGGINCNSFCGDAEVWSAGTNEAPSTSISITITLSSSGSSMVASIEGLDVSNVFPTATETSTYICHQSTDACGTANTLATSTSNVVQTGVTFVLAALQGGSVFNIGAGGYNAGVNYTIFYTGIFGNAGGGEWSLTAPSPTSYDFTVTLPYHASAYALAGATFTSQQTTVTVTSTATTNVQSSRNDTLLLYLAIIVIFLGLGVGIIRITRGVDRLPEAYQ